MRDIHVLVTDDMHQRFKKALKKLSYSTTAEWCRQKMREIIVEAELADLRHQADLERKLRATP